MRQERIVGALLGVEDLFAQALIGSPPHALRPGRKGRRHAAIAAEAPPDLVCLPDRTVQQVLALAGVGEAIAIPAEKVAPGPVQLDDAPTAGDPGLRRRGRRNRAALRRSGRARGRCEQSR